MNPPQPTDYKKVAKKLGIKYLFGRWGISFYSQMPEGNKAYTVRIIPLDGWTFNHHDIVEAFANDPVFSINYKEMDMDEKVTKSDSGMDKLTEFIWKECVYGNKSDIDFNSGSAQAAIRQHFKDLLGEDENCEKGHKEIFEWCSYCGVKSRENDLRTELRRRFDG